MSVNKCMIKVAVVVMGDVFNTDGLTGRAHRVIEALYHKCEITVINCSPQNKSRLAGMESVRMINLGDKLIQLLMSRPLYSPIKLFYSLLWNPKLTYCLLINKFDIVICIADFIGFPSIYLVSKIKGYKTILEAHSIFSEDVKAEKRSNTMTKLTRVAESFAVSHADYVVALSLNTLESYRKYNNKIGLLPVFIDTDLFKPKSKTQTTQSKLIGLVGPFDRSARQASCLEFIYRNIEYFDKRINFIIIGHCSRVIKHDRITFTGYLDSVEEYASQISSLDAVLVPETISTFGPLNKILEPMACSLPVFTTPEGMVGLYWVEPGRDIVVYKEYELVNKINKMIFNEECMSKIGMNAQKVVEQYYSKRANAYKYMNIIKDLMGR